MVCKKRKQIRQQDTSVHEPLAQEHSKSRSGKNKQDAISFKVTVDMTVIDRMPHAFSNMLSRGSG